MKIDLRTIDTVVVSLPSDAIRRTSAVALCERLGLTYRVVDAIQCSPGRIGCGLSHLKVLRPWDGVRPLLVLEDDVAASDAFSPIIEVPDNADAVWLGTSIFGTVGIVNHTGFIHMHLVEEAEYGLVRVHNLASSHAILHLTDRWRRAAMEGMTAAMVDRGWAPDSGLAMIQSDYNVYAVPDPLFYQAAHLQPPGRHGLEAWTRVRLTPTKPGTGSLIETRAGPRWVEMVRTARGLEWAWGEPR